MMYLLGGLLVGASIDYLMAGFVRTNPRNVSYGYLAATMVVFIGTLVVAFDALPAALLGMLAGLVLTRLFKHRAKETIIVLDDSQGTNIPLSAELRAQMLQLEQAALEGKDLETVATPAQIRQQRSI